MISLDTAEVSRQYTLRSQTLSQEQDACLNLIKKAIEAARAQGKFDVTVQLPEVSPFVRSEINARLKRLGYLLPRAKSRTEIRVDWSCSK
jgi:hypothetical protein